MPSDIEDHVEALPPTGEVLERAVDDVVCADGPDRVHLAGAADAGDFRAERFLDLYGEGANASRGADDEHLLTGLDPPVVAHSLQRGERRDRNGSSLLEGEIHRLGCELAGPDADVLRERAVADAVHLVALRETSHVVADGFDRSGEAPPRVGVLPLAEPKTGSSKLTGVLFRGDHCL